MIFQCQLPLLIRQNNKLLDEHRWTQHNQVIDSSHGHNNGNIAKNVNNQADAQATTNNDNKKTHPEAPTDTTILLGSIDGISLHLRLEHCFLQVSRAQTSDGAKLATQRHWVCTLQAL